MLGAKHLWSALAYVERNPVRAGMGLRSCTYSGRPFAEESFVTAIAEKFGRYWNRGRPRKDKSSKPDKTDLQAADLASRQFPLF